MTFAHTTRQTFFALIGSVSLATGIAGIFLPVLPTTCFVLFAAWCFARSSPRLHTWIRAHRWFGPMVRSWELDRAVPLRAKYLAVGITALTCMVSAWLVPIGWVRLILALVVLGVTILMFVLPTRPVSAHAYSRPHVV